MPSQEIDLGDLIAQTISGIQNHVTTAELDNVQMLAQAALQARIYAIELNERYKALVEQCELVKQSSAVINEVLTALIAREGGAITIRGNELVREPGYNYQLGISRLPETQGDIQLTLKLTAEDIPSTPPGTGKPEAITN